MKQLKIIIYGGSFNPPTIAHAAIIYTVDQIADYDQIWLMPSKDRYDKTINVPGKLRLMMLKALIKERFNKSSNIKICDFELNLQGNTKTCSTVRLLQEKYPSYDFTWLIGTDSWLNMDEWVNGTPLRCSVNWLIIPRDGYEINGQLPANAKLLNCKLFASAVSSTMVRRRIAENQSAVPFVTVAVNKIIEKYKLYRS